MACYAVTRSRADSTSDWRSFHLARWNASEILDSLEADLQEYKVGNVDWSYTLIAPSGQEYYCYDVWD